MPKFSARDTSNVLHRIMQIRVRDAGNVLRTIKRKQIRDENNVLRIVFQHIVAAVLPDSQYDSASGASGFGTVTGTALDATPTGVGPFTYQWHPAAVGNDPGMVIDTPTAATTTIHASVGNANPKKGKFYCVATDTVTGDTVTTNECEQTLEWFKT